MNIIGSVSNVLGSHAKVFRAFADHYDLVYFGRLHQEDDNQRIIRGVTLSTGHLDENYCVGTIQGYDVVVVRRTDRIAAPGSDKQERYSWIIMQFDLKTNYDFPHVFLDGGHHEEIFYQTLFVKFARLMKVERATFNSSGSFNQRFTAYTPPDALDDLPTILSGETSQTLAAHFGHFDFEWFQDRLLIYSTGRAPTKHLLEHMLRAGLWMADILDDHGNKKVAAHGGATTYSQTED